MPRKEDNFLDFLDDDVTANTKLTPTKSNLYCVFVCMYVRTVHSIIVACERRKMFPSGGLDCAR